MIIPSGIFQVRIDGRRNENQSTDLLRKFHGHANGQGSPQRMAHQDGPATGGILIQERLQQMGLPGQRGEQYLIVGFSESRPVHRDETGPFDQI